MRWTAVGVGSRAGQCVCRRTHLVLGVRPKGPCIAAITAENLHPMPLGEDIGCVESCGGADTIGLGDKDRLTKGNIMNSFHL